MISLRLSEFNDKIFTKCETFATAVAATIAATTVATATATATTFQSYLRTSPRRRNIPFCFKRNPFKPQILHIYKRARTRVRKHTLPYTIMYILNSTTNKCVIVRSMPLSCFVSFNFKANI